eukprot:Blabericola_migrator_1__2484@NODE_16_length_23467_cov_90_205256_g13_i0_p9_GENE_NODE_16_length_23467_cov_90_205256_g13_i0NODE_16_length_23467_cov_90_205256_g13_i0_p9_ORF_typecomplete_len309_score89_30SNAP/PF14938_6/3_2e55TPR_12/PF13424_6/3_5e05TPR_12/PF13424_6/0_00044TPR_7/PF13176_6/0_066TPR_7/PF13176_6/30TPR_7/PF13176_6/0_16TPR_7/PF13176_6/3_2TPR_MalT/PF17874_1/1_1e05TPR_2/PF07719_17/2_6e03TPR_2/PF07719_17/0_0012TPR_2/PF07719_17/2_3e02TPR_2/PF07719_17/0_94TPR_2/PF07719_17/47TPR_2/PF07719_17/2_8e
MEAAALREEAEKKLKGGFLSFLKGGPKYEEASDLFANAGNLYKTQKMWNEAANCYEKAAELQAKVDDRTQEAKYYVEAGHVLKNISTNVAAEKYDLAAKLYVKSGRFSQAARLMKTLAEVCESEGNLSEALVYYKKAADWFELDEYGKSNCSQCMIKYADLISKVKGELDEAIQIYEAEGTKTVKNTLTQFGAKEHFFKAGLLQLAKGDAITASVACDRYEQADPRFAGSMEGKLYKALCHHYEADDMEGFVDAVAEYDRMSRLDPWKLHFLNKIKGSMSQANTLPKSHQAAPPPPEAAQFDFDDDLT